MYTVPPSLTFCYCEVSSEAHKPWGKEPGAGVGNDHKTFLLMSYQLTVALHPLLRML